MQGISLGSLVEVTTKALVASLKSLSPPRNMFMTAFDLMGEDGIEQALMIVVRGKHVAELERFARELLQRSAQESGAAPTSIGVVPPSNPQKGEDHG